MQDGEGGGVEEGGGEGAGEVVVVEVEGGEGGGVGELVGEEAGEGV